jgi:hypothetical protein
VAIVGVRITVFEAQAIAEARAALAANGGLRDIAEQIVGVARGSAPVESGEWMNSMQVTGGGDKVYASSTDDESIYKEYGTSDTPAHGTMTNAARQFGKYSGMQPGRR